ncbi:MAG: septal ring lytic transglycosylase RlpA family protein [Okeania sp. SIO2G4]|uniref:septal ring lytic transglycosylase RlpA family protein n=1 Tax=unclassified Okeania TaxID=2634635 RepID=UPI0013B71E76|nr:MULTISPECIES: septal ring lytic transglycosylase RlpA family protein [unclassified Okeania]NEP40706.1 septal ring lytic transglycosylase RlpA family protein [Okeania sp. SIO2H7]NEP72708.1 septal ring lytic transglycosylase RlpA family protein [Okeania sp. SIO2G5]NEP96673.1 septal ring lytic transglycosylase RlpA family protein [Okeania sp. SIO2F5]NEQ91332.1 septal ring lytic transglycosylase RlpA family protein [Okeania sp. SIO2G4]
MKYKIWTFLTTFLIFSSVGVDYSYADTLQEDKIYQKNEPTDRSLEINDNLQKTVANRQANVFKVGEYQLNTRQGKETVTEIMAHELTGRQAATLYVRNIPVLTFLDSQDKKANNSPESNSDSSVKVATIQSSNSNQQKDPVWRASIVASQLNQLMQENPNLDITAKWDTDTESYMILVNDQKLVEIDKQTILPDTTNDLATDTLQATNRLRRQVNNAPPLKEIAGQPKPKPQPEPQKIAVRPITFQDQGWASWYGPGFHGNLSASGERYNQYAMTAAHKTLPFGTKVRVTNLNNGSSVVVRINDRGPFIRGRVIDLSAAAARILGMIHSGVAPVKVEVIDSRGS